MQRTLSQSILSGAFAIVFTVGVAIVLAEPLCAQEGVPEAESAEPSKADDHDWVERATRILEIGGEARSTDEEKNKAYRELKNLKPSAEDDSRYVYAYILASMAEKKWQFAHDLSADLLKRDKNYIPVRVANARSLLMMVDKKLLPAIAELETLARGLDSPSDTVTRDQLEAAASFLGLAVGFMEGPWRESVKATILSDLLTTTESIPDELKGPFSKARETIRDEYRALVDGGESALKKMREDLDKDAEKLRAELEMQRKAAAEQKESNRKRLEESWAKAKGGWDNAWTQCQNLLKNASTLQLQQEQLYTQSNLLRAPIPDAKGNVDQFAQRRYLETKAQLQNSIANIGIQLNNLSTQYDIAVRNGTALENQMNAIRAEAQREGLNFEMQNESFSKMEKIVKGKEKKAEKVETKLSGGKLRHARAFTTYDNFNYFKEQSLLFDSFPSR